jgi:hypothetical protein
MTDYQAVAAAARNRVEALLLQADERGHATARLGAVRNADGCLQAASAARGTVAALLEG